MIQRDGDTIYELNAQGVIRWYAGVQAGHDDSGNRTTEKELKKIAEKLRAADELYDALDRCRLQLDWLDDDHPLMIDVRAALAKARGES